MVYTLEHTDPGGARLGHMTLTHGTVETPIFMPVGTLGTVKALTPVDLKDLGAQICLANTYHLHLRPGTQIVEEHGGLHQMMGWDRPILTDSGGYQVFSLRDRCKISEDGVAFQSHLDGSRHLFTPERVIQIQEILGSDIAMAFDECPPSTAPIAAIEASMARTTRWAKRCIDARTRTDQAVFGIVQGGLSETHRAAHVDAICALPFDGFAIGGLSVGESTEDLHALTSFTAPRLPKDHVRYLMGVGTPENLLHAIGAGVDIFDCVLPTRDARTGKLFTRDGDLNIKNARHAHSMEPIDAECACYACATFTRAYLKHLHRSKEILYARLATLHNLTFYLRLMADARVAIRANRYAEWASQVVSRRAEGQTLVRGPESRG
jgi:queuine tRNA-ribosyltransferase